MPAPETDLSDSRATDIGCLDLIQALEAELARKKADTAGRKPVDREDVALELRRRGPRDRKLRIAVGGAGQDRVQQHLDPWLVSWRVVSGNQMS